VIVDVCDGRDDTELVGEIVDETVGLEDTDCVIELEDVPVSLEVALTVADLVAEYVGNDAKADAEPVAEFVG
jgi:hypothetical protein